ncbi:DNA topoisomerase 4 subunit A [bacterium]|nr:DNA topoisomerase 4 subunit A [bacterium]
MEDKNLISSALIEEEMKESYVDYAMSVIVARALPDARDGLKPVHRRIIYTMFEEHITPDRKFRKSAATVGNVIAHYHPHGDASVYDAMVRLAQPFNLRYPLVWPQGNFGSVDGDPPASMRYTEAKLAPMAMELVRDIGKDTVDWSPNFDNSTQEPKVLPLVIPNLLINGSEGIAVGMAARIPPHNLAEVIDACVAALDDPEITLEGLMEHIQGPDFPTGGFIVGTHGIREAYKTGRGRILVRSLWHREEISGRTAVVIDEIPYMVNKANLVERAAQAIKEKKINGIHDLRDESNRKGIRIVFELKKKVDPDIVEKELLTYTYLQVTYGIIMLALVDNVPKVLTLKEAIEAFLQHRWQVVTRRTEYDLAKAKARLHIVEGLLKALLYIHDIIQVIKTSPNVEVAKNKLQDRWQFSDKQVQAILEMRLQRLTHLERNKLEEEKEDLLRNIAYLEDLLANSESMKRVIITELEEIKSRYKDERRTRIIEFNGDPSDDLEDSEGAEGLVFSSEDSSAQEMESYDSEEYSEAVEED